MTQPDDQMWQALIEFRARHGADWKDTLSIKWMNGQDEYEPHSSSLRRIRNHLGPSWLCDLDEQTLDAAERRLDNLAKLPDMCACPHHETGEPIIIKRGESGYWPMPTHFTIAKVNADFEATPAMIAAMQAGAMFGWHVPAADPDRYDATGRLTASAARRCS